MPELPEVEFARRVVAQWAEGRTILRARVADARILDEGVRARAVVRALTGRAIVSVARRGKWLRIALDDTQEARVVFSHLGMTGRWQATTLDAPELRFEKVRLDLAGGGETSSLRYTDPRLFGRFVVVVDDLPAWNALGPDPLLDGIDAGVLATKLARRKKKTIKETLLDQTLLAGIGNIQAQEALFRAKLHPARMASDLSTREVRRLAAALLESIHATLALTPEGETKIVYVEEAGATNPFAIYGREGAPCPRCARALVKIVQGGRSTIFCAGCQRLDSRAITPATDKVSSPRRAATPRRSRHRAV